MTALANWADYVARNGSPRELLLTNVSAITAVAGRQYSSWQANFPGAGGTPGASAVPARTLSGAVGGGQQNADAHQLFLTGARLASTAAGAWILCDRLVHQGGSSAIVTGAQATNLPTAALTRYTDGVGVMAALEIYTQIGTTATTFTVSYTNEAGTAGISSVAATIGGTGFREVRRLIPIPLAAGDTGVRAVANVNLLASTTTAGSFGVTLYKPLYGFHIDRVGAQHNFNFIDGGQFGGMPEILDDACLFWMYIGATTAALSGTLTLTAV